MMLSRTYAMTLALCSVLLALFSCKEVARSMVERPYLIGADSRHEIYIRQSNADTAFMYFTWEADDILMADQSLRSVEGMMLVFRGAEGTASDTLGIDLPSNPFMEAHARIHGRIPVPLSSSDDYRLELNFNVGSTSFDRTIYIDAEDPLRSVDIRVDDVPRAFCACEPGQSVELRSFDWTEGRIEMTLMEMEHRLPPPPFSVHGTRVPKFTPFESQLLTLADGLLSFECPEADAIQLTFTETEAPDLVIPIFRRGFPEVLEVEEMVGPLRYITSAEEFDDLTYAEDQRAAIEGFWLARAGERERARQLMADYYGRVQEANAFFTDEVEGWRTDRGMTHIVFGTANRVERVGDRELWLYSDGSSDNERGLQLLFYHLDAVSLDRSLEYKPYWGLTVDAWRSGKRLAQ